jgi:hypothetical protein
VRDLLNIILVLEYCLASDLSRWRGRGAVGELPCRDRLSCGAWLGFYVRPNKPSNAINQYIVIYQRNVLEKGFSEATVLPSSQQHDSVLSTCVADLNWDGINELVLGTFGRVSRYGCYNVVSYDHPPPPHESLSLSHTCTASVSLPICHCPRWGLIIIP